MYVETDFLLAVLKDDDWLGESAERALDTHDDIHTSILAYTEVLMLLYERETAGDDLDPARAITDLLELVPIRPAVHERAVLAAAGLLDEHDLTPFDALHAGFVSQGDRRILTSEMDYDAVGLTRVPLEPD